MKKKTARRHNYSLIAGLILTGLLVAVILIGTIWTPYDPNAMSAGEKLLAPSLSHPFGTDNFGRDIFSRVLEGARTTLFIGVCTVAIGTLFGVLAGSLTGYVSAVYITLNASGSSGSVTALARGSAAVS